VGCSRPAPGDVRPPGRAAVGIELEEPYFNYRACSRSAEEHPAAVVAQATAAFPFVSRSFDVVFCRRC
jgi:hypothetical protein